MRKIPLVSLLVFVVTAVHAQETLLLGPQIYVNSTTTGPQSSASVSGRTNGEFVVSWADVYPAPQCSVRAQSFSPTGTRMEDEKTAYLCPAGDTDIRTTEVFAQETGQFVGFGQSCTSTTLDCFGIDSAEQNGHRWDDTCESHSFQRRLGDSRCQRTLGKLRG